MSGPMVFLHILGAAIWAGGLLTVALVAVASRRAVPAESRIELFRFVGFGFLVLAGIATAMIGLSGNLMIEDFGGWETLGDSEFGNLILWKTVIFAGVIALALVHSIVLGPRIRGLREAQLAGDGDERALRRTVALSTVAQVLMLAGVLVIFALAADLAT
jgi:putative copper export protein